MKPVVKCPEIQAARAAWASFKGPIADPKKLYVNFVNEGEKKKDDDKDEKKEDKKEEGSDKKEDKE